MLKVKKIAQLTGHNASVFALAKGKDARHFLSGSGDGWVVEWSLDNPDLGKLIARVERNNELESLKEETRLEHLHVYWGAKEALYKAYGRRELDFRKHIHIEPFSYDLDNGFCSGQVLKGDFNARYQIWYERRGDFILVWAIEE